MFGNGNISNQSLENLIILGNYITIKKAKVIDRVKKILYDDGSEFVLPISDDIELLNNNNEFYIIFVREPNIFSKIKGYPWYFSYPNNVAVYYSNGELKHKLINTVQDNKCYIDKSCFVNYPWNTWQCKFNGSGFIISNDDRYPEGVFCLYKNNHKSIITDIIIDRSR